MSQLDFQMSFLECLRCLLIDDSVCVLSSIAPTKMKLIIGFGKMTLLEEVLKIETIIREEILKNISFEKLKEIGVD